MSEQKRPGNKHISVCIDRSLYEKFESYCRDAGLSKPEAYTIAVRAYIEEDMRASAPRQDSMTTPAGDADDFRFLSVGVERALYEKIDRYCRKYNLYKSDFSEKAVRKYLDRGTDKTWQA